MTVPIKQMTLKEFLIEKASAELEIKQEVQSILDEFYRTTGLGFHGITINVINGTIVDNVNIRIDFWKEINANKVYPK